MNCYEWRKHITGSVSVDVNYEENGDGYQTIGSGTITHGNLYTGWTRKELQCQGRPTQEGVDWILRGSGLCGGRSILIGELFQSSTIEVTTTFQNGDPSFTEQWGIWFQLVSENYMPVATLLPLSPYPNWENDPYSVATRAQIDALETDFLRVYAGASAPPVGAPAPNSVPIRWLKNGLGGTSENGFLEINLNVSFTLQ